MSLVQRTINQCDVCGHEWIPRSNGERCGNRECRSTKWNNLSVAGSIPVRLPRSGEECGSNPPLSDKVHSSQRGEGMPAGKDRPKDMEALRQICAGNILGVKYEPVLGPIEIPICGKRWWEDGTQYECLMDKGHREQKHGLRGMVQRLED
jgi:rubredoxin